MNEKKKTGSVRVLMCGSAGTAGSMICSRRMQRSSAIICDSGNEARYKQISAFWVLSQWIISLIVCMDVEIGDCAVELEHHPTRYHFRPYEIHGNDTFNETLQRLSVLE